MLRNLTLVFALLAQVLVVGAASAEGGEIVFAGLRPAKSADLEGLAIRKISEAQNFRELAVSAIDSVTGAKVRSHGFMREAIGAKYLVALFECEGDVTCISKVVNPLRARKVKEIVIGVYHAAGKTVSFRLRTIAVTGEVRGEVKFKIAKSKLESISAWATAVGPLFTTTGSVHIVTNVKKFKCLIDTKPCVFAKDGQTIAAAEGDHVVEISAEGYQSKSQGIKVARGKVQSVAIGLDKIPSIADLIEANDIDLTQLLKKSEDGIRLGGMARVRYRYRAADRNNNALGGDAGFHTLNIVAFGKVKDIELNAEYRFGSSIPVLRWLWFGYNASEKLKLKLGVIRIPFGLYFVGYWVDVSPSFYMGLDDNYDMGTGFEYKPSDSLKIDFAYFKGDELANAARNDRYAPDVFDTPGSPYRAQHTAVLRADWTKNIGDSSSISLGTSGLAGGLYRRRLSAAIKDGWGYRWAASLHGRFKFGNLKGLAQAIHYEFVSDDGPAIDTSTIQFGGFGVNWPVATSGTLIEAAAQYKISVDKGPFEALAFHTGYARLFKGGPARFEDSTQTALGMELYIGPIWLVGSVFLSQNMLFKGATREALGRGELDAPWRPSVVVHAAYYWK